MNKRYTPIEKMTALLLLALLVLAVFPMEQPGMLGLWYGIEPSVVFQYKFLRLTIIEVLLGSALVFSYLSYSSFRRVRYKNHFGLVIVLFVACILWGYLGTLLSDQGFGMDNLGTGNWKKLAYGMILFVILSLFLDTRKKIDQSLLAITLACIVLDLYGLGRYVLLGGLQTEKYIGNVVFWETVKLSLNVFVFILSTGLLFFSNRTLGRTEKMIYQVALVMSLAVIFFSSRRTSMIMAMVAAGIYIWLLFKRGQVGKSMMIIGTGSLLVLIIVMFNFEAFETKFLSRMASIQGVFNEEVEVDAGSTQGHMQELEVGWATIMENPVWGVGFSWDNDNVTGADRFWVHNSVLTFWMRFGILGVITYFYLYFKILTVLWSASKKDKSIIPFVFFIWFFVEFLSGLFFPPFFGYFKSAALFFGTLAIANSYLNTQDFEPKSSTSEAILIPPNNDRILRKKRGHVVRS